MNPIRPTGHTEAEPKTGDYIKGVAICLVTQNKDEEGLCRIQVSYPWHDKPLESYWARLAMPMAGTDRGLLLVPEVGDEVLVAFERGDLRFPCVLGALWNGKDKPPFPINDGKNDKRGLRSRKKHYLLFDDGEHGIVELAHEKGRKITFDDQGFSVQDENGNTVKVDSSSGAMTLEAKGTLSIKAASISIEATGTIEVKASATLTIRGSLVNIN
jgi:uncharacterized protein involved in type VI secretion and phage assembly